MTAPRLRMVAGPNGSGKSTLFEDLKTRGFLLGHLLNPDLIERQLLDHRRLDLTPFAVEIEERALRAFVAAHPLGKTLSQETFSVQGTTLIVTPEFRAGYFAAVFADFMRHRWLAAAQSFTFETVMSSGDKLDVLSEARDRGYRTYLYYICTDSPIINRERVASRVAQGGHDVPSDKIDARYQRSLALLPEAIRRTDRAYLFDNSGKSHRLIGEFESAKLIAASEDLPNWFVERVLSQKDFVA